jgi:hypothetical protein
LSVANAERIVACDPPGAAEQMREYVNNERRVPQRGPRDRSFMCSKIRSGRCESGRRDLLTFERLWNAPRIRDVSRRGGPGADGYYLIGMASPVPIRRDRLGHERNTTRLERRECRLCPPAEPWQDIDD